MKAGKETKSYNAEKIASLNFFFSSTFVMLHTVFRQTKRETVEKLIRFPMGESEGYVI